MIDIPSNACPICLWTPAQSDRTNGDAASIDCPLCGRFVISGSLRAVIRHPENVPLLAALAIYLRATTDAGGETTLTFDTWRGHAESIRGGSPSRKIERTLELVAADSRPGRWHNEYQNDALTRSLLMRRVGIEPDSHDELDFIFEALVRAGYVTYGDENDAKLFNGVRPLPSLFGSGGVQVRVTAKGWAHLEQGHALGVPGHCFVAMSFDTSLTPVYVDAIVPSIETDCGLIARRVDRIEHVDSIDDRIIAEILAGQLAVADFTGQRAGVYFEAGFARGLGRPVIWTCREDDLKNLHFDTRQFSFIVWKDPDDLRERLTRRIRALGLAKRLA